MRGGDPGLGVPSGAAGDRAGDLQQSTSEGPIQETATNSAGPRSFPEAEAGLETGTPAT